MGNVVTPAISSSNKWNNVEQTCRPLLHLKPVSDSKSQRQPASQKQTSFPFNYVTSQMLKSATLSHSKKPVRLSFHQRLGQPQLANQPNYLPPQPSLPSSPRPAASSLLAPPPAGGTVKVDGLMGVFRCGPKWPGGFFSVGGVLKKHEKNKRKEWLFVLVINYYSKTPGSVSSK